MALTDSLIVLNTDFTEEQIQRNGKIEFSEFLQLMDKNLRNIEPEELIRSAFDVIDQHGDGFITYQQLRHVVHEMELGFTDDDLRDMITEADTAGDGRVSYQDFMSMMTNNF
ncbi:CALM-like protein [Mya arenaria]|uniref:CALM-like protein n=1 Tax=Mya arenaria TaxID=6604 RepID=A0ABY7FCK0_MYAAR|nr:CALM-like protein [Mya arenaria]